MKKKPSPCQTRALLVDLFRLNIDAIHVSRAHGAHGKIILNRLKSHEVSRETVKVQVIE